MQICILNFHMKILNDMISYIFKRLDRMQHTKIFFCIFYRLLEIKNLTNLKRSCQTHPQAQKFKKQFQTKPRDFFFIRLGRCGWINPVGLTRPSRFRNKLTKETKTKTDQTLQKHKNLKIFQSK